MSLLFNSLKAQVESHPEKLCIIEGDVRWDYQTLFEKICRLSHSLSEKGIQPDDRVALMFMNQKEFLIGFFAVLRVGAVVVPVNIQLPAEDIGYVIQNSGARMVLTTAKLAPNFDGKPIPILVANQDSEENENDKENKYPSFEEAIEQGSPSFEPRWAREANQMSILMYTSGTTGKPKGVMLSEENLISNTEGFGEALHFDSNEKILMALPLFHAYGLIVTLYALAQGVTLALVPNFNPRKIMKLVAEEEITILPLVPTIFSFVADGLKKLGADLFKSIKVCISGGASLPPALLKSLEETADMTILEGYGLTESSPVISVNRLSQGSIPGSVGKPLSNVEVRLVDDAGQVIQQTQGQNSPVGEIQAKGPNIMLGYFNLPEATQETMTEDGWLKTGDLGHLDAEGNLYISGGRKKDLIIKAGENISPLRIENTLYQHPAIQEACVFGVPEPKLGEDIFAAISLKEDQSVELKDLKKFCREQLTPFMTPSYFRIYPELPKNATGKILKKDLKVENKNAATAGCNAS